MTEFLLNDFTEKLIKDGPCHCETCGRYAQVYKRRIHSAVARQLIEIWNLGIDDYVHARDLILDGLSGVCDLGKAKYFGLVAQKENTDDGLKANGYWKLTQKGIDFIKNGARIPEYVLVFDDRVIGVAQTDVDINDCLGYKFDYRNLMDGI
jgi:hypothetical protein